ncbi:MAG: dolichyl-phosphate beta-glucosyltransferase [Candidatus Dormiibacterota bacterium]
MDLSIVVPCYNEQRRLLPALGALYSYLENAGLDHELILVDDGSTDATLALMRRAAARRHDVCVVAISPNRGKGRAVAEGVRVASGATVLVTDADLSTPIEELAKLEAALDAGADIAIGSRAAPGAREVDQPLHRRVMGKTFNRLVRALLLPGFRDTQCGFKLFRGEVARSLFADLQTNGFAFDVEILWRAQEAGRRVAEVPVRWFNSDSSSVAPITASAAMLSDLVSLRIAAGARRLASDQWLSGGSER